jgi:hypothetical protein
MAKFSDYRTNQFLKAEQRAIEEANKCDVVFLEYVDKEIDRRYRWRVQCKKCGTIKDSFVKYFKNCRVCFDNKQRSSKEEFISKSRAKHGNKYNYDLIEYKNSISKVNIFCNDCKNIFQQTPGMHISGSGCKICHLKSLTHNSQDFIKKAIVVHGDKYNYDSVEYKTSRIKVKIYCNTCNIFFEQKAQAHLNGNGCPQCADNYWRLSKDEFVLKAKKVHGNKYDYSSVEYKNSNLKVSIFCNNCKNIFHQKPHNHLSGNGCSICKESKGEIKIAKWLRKNNIFFHRQYIFGDLKNIKHLKVDFFVPSWNCIIEYDGEGHEKPIWGSTMEIKVKNLLSVQHNDKIKNEYAKNKNINMLRINWKEFEIVETILEKILKQQEVKQIYLET